MSGKVDKIVKTYKLLAQIPSIVGARINSNGIINSVWSQRNLEKGKITKFLKTILVSDDLKKVVENFPVDVSDELLTSTSDSEQLRAVIRDVDSKQFLEVWKNYNLIRAVDLNALDAHGNVYTDVEFSSLEFSPDEKKLLYVAEKKIPKSEPFYKRKGKTDEASSDAPKSRGEEYIYEQDWGEQLVGKKKSVIVQYDIENDSVEILAGLPENKCVAQPKYSPDGQYIVGVSYETVPRKLGLIYCSNRANTIFTLDFNGNYVEIKLSNCCVKSPRFTPDGKTIIWQQQKAGGPHANALALMKTKVPITENTAPQTVVEVVEVSKVIENNNVFYGLYNTGYPKRCWADNNRLILTTIKKYTMVSYVVDIESGKISELVHEDGSQIVLDVFEGKILVARRNFLKPDYLAIGKLPSEGSEDKISFTQLTPSETVETLKDCTYNYLNLKALEGDFQDYNAIYLGPKAGEKNSVPLVVFPHGGPHSAFANYLFLDAALLLSCGYAVLLINYRGSIGSGAKSVGFLPGKIGTSDVADCIQSTDETLKTYPWLNAEKLVLKGGSHGGFLVAHLSGQYPDKFKAVVARNPVIDVASMSIISDIPDWCFVEVGEEYTQKGEISSQLLLSMLEKSPIMHAHKVKAPTLLQIGTKDLRVPQEQGIEYYHRLRANNVSVKMNIYEDNHPLGTVPTEMDCNINTVLFYEDHLGHN